MVSLDPEGTITSWNPAAESLYGYQAAEAVGSSVSMLFAQPEEAVSALRRVLSEGQGTEVEATRVRKDGSEVTVGETLSPLRAEGRVAGFVAVARNIGARLEVERALAETRRELEEKNRSLARSNSELEQFAYVASHDLSEPLRAVAGMVSLLARRYGGKLDDDADEFIAFAVEGCERMRAMIEDLLEFSRAGRTELHVRPVDLASLVQQTVQSLSAQIDEAHATVNAQDLPTVSADAPHLARVVQNLISNAVKFRRPDVPPVITVSASSQDGMSRIEVADNGIGIEQQYRPRVFGMFERLHTRDRYTGTGMGLAITERIIDRHGGTIGVDETPGGGSTFWFTLPDGPSEEHVR